MIKPERFVARLRWRKSAALVAAMRNAISTPYQGDGQCRLIARQARKHFLEYLMKEPVVTAFHAGVASIMLNRPGKANTLDQATSVALVAAIEAIMANDSVRVVLLKASGKMFCAGGDIEGLTKGKDDLPSMLGAMLAPLHEAILKLATLSVPVVAALNGPIGGSGIGLALCADFVLAAESMKLRSGYSAIGLTPDVGSSWFLTRRVGPARAKNIFFLNLPLTAQECFSCGIVDAVYPDDQLLTEADSLVARLACGAAGSFAKIKHLVDGAGARTLKVHLALERDYMIACAGTPDAREGIAAFMEKRTPLFGEPDWRSADTGLAIASPDWAGLAGVPAIRAPR